MATGLCISAINFVHQDGPPERSHRPRGELEHRPQMARDRPEYEQRSAGLMAIDDYNVEMQEQYEALQALSVMDHGISGVGLRRGPPRTTGGAWDAQNSKKLN